MSRQKGSKLSEKHKQRIREAHKKSGLIPPSQKGVKRSEETKLRLRNSHLGKTTSEKHKKLMKEMFTGEKNPNWKGGITPISAKIRSSLEYKLWRESVFKRDNYTCIWCGNNMSGNLNADHIKSFADYPELRFAIDNGRTLCVPCHKKTSNYPTNFRSQTKYLVLQ